MAEASGEAHEWHSWGRDPGGNRYSPLAQINPNNVGRLERAWIFKSGDLGRQGPAKWVFECVPLMADGKLFVLTPLCRAIALNPVTGDEIWSYDPNFDVKTNGGMLAARGLAYWSKGDERRILLPVIDGRLISLDARTGKVDVNFGKGLGGEGTVDLRKAMHLSGNELRLTSPPAVCGDIAVQGFSIGDGPNKSPLNPLIAVHIETGEIAWKFNTIPQKGEFGAESWEGDSALNRAGGNVWSLMSVDPARGWVFAPVTSPKFDFYGGDRQGANLFSNCVVALDAKTGKRIWHYQCLHHDLWDYDLPAQPNLVELTIDGKKIAAVAQIGKTGFVYLVNRETGEPIFPIEERPVPKSDVPGEEASPTQPFPTKPPALCKQGLTEADLSHVVEENHADLVERYRKLRSEGLFTPPSLEGSIQMPGFHGGGNWSGGAFDPTTGLLYVNTTDLACVQKLIETPQGDFRYRHNGYERFRDKAGYPANAPPWGLLNAVDLNKGEFAWRVPLGEFEELSKKGIPITGQENFGGPIVTAGGLVFIASTLDECLRAFDKASGKELFKTKLDVAGYAAPITYQADGKQYVVICCGGGGKLGTNEGDAVIAFRLPNGS